MYPISVALHCAIGDSILIDDRRGTKSPLKSESVSQGSEKKHRGMFDDSSDDEVSLPLIVLSGGGIRVVCGFAYI